MFFVRLHYGRYVYITDVKYRLISVNMTVQFYYKARFRDILRSRAGGPILVQNWRSNFGPPLAVHFWYKARFRDILRSQLAANLSTKVAVQFWSETGDTVLAQSAFSRYTAVAGWRSNPGTKLAVQFWSAAGSPLLVQSAFSRDTAVTAG